MQPLQVLDLTTNQVTVDDQTVAVNDLSKPVNEDNKAVPVAPAAETQEAPAELQWLKYQQLKHQYNQLFQKHQTTVLQLSMLKYKIKK